MNDCVLVLVLLCRFWQLRMADGFLLSYVSNRVYIFPLILERGHIASPAQIRTGVKGSKGLYAWPLQSAEQTNPPPGFPGIFDRIS